MRVCACVVGACVCVCTDPDGGIQTVDLILHTSVRDPGVTQRVQIWRAWVLADGFTHSGSFRLVCVCVRVCV